MTSRIKKAIRTIASLTKRIQHLNFKSEQEVIETHELQSLANYYDSRYRSERFSYYLHLFDLKEAWLFDELTEKEAEQYGLIWKLVDLEGGCHD